MRWPGAFAGSLPRTRLAMHFFGMLAYSLDALLYTPVRRFVMAAVAASVIALGVARGED